MSPSASRVNVRPAFLGARLRRIAKILAADVGVEEAALLEILARVAEASAAVPPRGDLAALLGAASFDELRVTVVDGYTVRVGCGKRAVRRTYRDLGLHSAMTREPTKKWAILLAVCAGHGTFRWRDFGELHAVSQAVSVLRRGLQDAFGLDDDPFHSFNNGWRARFFASSES
jgi:hypothetical protein